MIVTYTIILILYLAPVASNFFAQTYFPRTPSAELVRWTTITSPFAAVHEIPLYVDDFRENASLWVRPQRGGAMQLLGYSLYDFKHLAGHLGFSLALNIGLFLGMIGLFNRRWRVSMSTA